MIKARNVLLPFDLGAEVAESAENAEKNSRDLPP
jgi:hypothetical protein